MTKDQLNRLSDRVDQFIQLEVGKQLPYVGLLVDPVGEKAHLAIFTNRRSNTDVRMILEEALNALNHVAPDDWEEPASGQLK